MPDPTLADPYFGETINITPLNTKVNLLKLMQAIAPNLTGTLTVLSIQADAANTAPVLIGSDRITATNYGLAIAPGTIGTYSTSQQTPVPAGRIWLWATAASAIHVEAFV